MIVRYLPDQALVVSWDGRALTHHGGDAELTALHRYLPAGGHALATNAPAAFDDGGALVFLDGERLLRLPLGAEHAELVCAGVPEARGLHVANGGELVALRRDYGPWSGKVVVRSLRSGALLWRNNDEHCPIDSVKFSPSGELLLWEWDRPVQSGSDVMVVGVCRAASGEGLFSDSHTCWDQSYYWGADDRRLLYGYWGQAPQRARAVHDGGASARVRDELIGVKPLAARPPAMPSFAALRRQLGWTR